MAKNEMIFKVLGLHYLVKEKTKKLHLFTWLLHAFLSADTQNTLNYHLVTAKPPFTV